ncbi:MAG TPA: HAD family phosphatase [Bryobacterales bacterium]|nr:HAD family phosphatase [Bryobacterales bacterium]
MIQAIFFDFDGVLVDSEPLHFACWAEALAQHGIAITAESYYRRFTGVSDHSMIDALCREFGAEGDRPLFTACFHRKKQLYRERAAEFCHIPPELVTFLADLSAAYRLGVVSSSDRPDVEPHLAAHGVRRWFRAVVCREDVRNLKPAPDPYLRALELLNDGDGAAVKSAECLVVEDSAPGEEAGRQAGMRVLRVRRPEEVADVLRRELDGTSDKIYYVK